jgi:hypothetical protein
MSATKNSIIGTLAAGLAIMALATSADATSSPGAQYQNLRSRDAGVAGARSARLSGAGPSPSVTPSDSDWGTIGIVAGGVLILTGVGGVALVTRGRSTSRSAGAAVGSS